MLDEDRSPFTCAEHDDVKLMPTHAHDDAKSAVSADLLRLYLDQIGKVPLLDADQEVALAKRIEAGLLAAERLVGPAETDGISESLRRDLQWLVRDGERAMVHLVEANLRLVVSQARRYPGKGISFLDLVQEGNLGLIRAVKKFDYSKGFKFSTYAVWWIRQSIFRAIADQGRTIRLPLHLIESINRLDRVEREMTHALGRVPTVVEVSEELAVSPEKVHELRRCSREPLSLDQAIGDDDGSLLGGLIEDSGAAIPVDVVTFGLLRDQMRTVLAGLTERENSVVSLRFGLIDGRVRTLEEVGKMFGLSRERIRQIEHLAMGKLRRDPNALALAGYLES